MSRRRFISSSTDYEPPMTSGFEEDMEASLYNPTASQVVDLARMLSAKSAVSTTSSFAAQQTKAHEEANRAKTFRKIGAGACGAIFAAEGPTAYKTGKTGTDDDGTFLWTDFQMHQRILKALRGSNADIEIPTCHFYIDHDDERWWWDKHKELAAAAQDTCHIPARVLVTERVLPLPDAIRQKLIDMFCKESLRATAAKDSANKDCLVRVYLGSMRGRVMSFFSLRNFKLHLNQMIDIGLDYEGLAVSMGQALALIHWRARTDARDVEFVLGCSSTRMGANSGQAVSVEPGTSSNLENPGTEDLTRRETRLFVIDFNQVRDISMDDAGVELAVEAFFLNDPYYPRPREGSKLQQELWNSFVRNYLDTADVVLGIHNDYRILPRKFISGVIKRIAQKNGQD
ncbi:zinc finger protein-domain-containing protein [Hypoxylon sp. FL1284]|nr:zinc finger protein-domain-containing protein [Hypoxylon sp. FL1284]